MLKIIIIVFVSVSRLSLYGNFSQINHNLVLQEQRDYVLTNINNRSDNITVITKEYDEQIKNITNLSNDSTLSFFKDWINE